MNNSRTNHQRVGRPRGFTLVEVLVSLAIIAVLLPAIMYGVNIETSAATLAKNRTQAAMLAQQKLEEIVAIGQLQSDSGEFDGYPQFSWTAEVNTWDGLEVTDPATIDSLDLTVTWKQEGQPRSVVVSTLIYENNATTTGGVTGLGGGLP